MACLTPFKRRVLFLVWSLIMFEISFLGVNRVLWLIKLSLNVLLISKVSEGVATHSFNFTDDRKLLPFHFETKTRTQRQPLMQFESPCFSFFSSTLIAVSALLLYSLGISHGLWVANHKKSKMCINEASLVMAVFCRHSQIPNTHTEELSHVVQTLGQDIPETTVLTF